MKNVLAVYFSGTGNSAYVAKLFAAKMGGKCLSIEDETDFCAEFAAHDIIAFCYPIYGSRVPLIMRQFAARYAADLQGKKLVIFATQWAFSGDGARVFTDLFPEGHFDVIYADHIIMPNNVNNLFLLREVGTNRLRKRAKAVESKIERICRDINSGIVKRRGFSGFSRLLGSMQGKPWQGNSASAVIVKGSMEDKYKSRVKVYKNCTACGLCVTACPMKNLEIHENKIIHNNNCTTCYRCVNLCPHKAITVFFCGKPRWRYGGIPTDKI